MLAIVSSAIWSRLRTLSLTAQLTSRPSGVLKAMVRVSVSIDSIQALTVTLLAKDTPTRGTACTWPCAAAGKLIPNASIAAKIEMPAAPLIERIVMARNPCKTATRRTIAIRSGGATGLASAEMPQHGLRHRLGLIEIGEVARACDRLHPRRAIDAFGQFPGVAGRQHAIGVAP